MSVLLELSRTLLVKSTFGRTDSSAAELIEAIFEGTFEGTIEGISEGIFEDSGGAGGMTESIRPWPKAWDFNISQIYP